MIVCQMCLYQKGTRIYCVTKLQDEECKYSLVISKSKGPSDSLRDICTSTYQICRTEKNTNQTTKFCKQVCNLTPLVRNIEKIVEKGRNCSSGAISPFNNNILKPDVRLLC